MSSHSHQSAQILNCSLGQGRAQSLTYQKALNDWERQRFQLEMDQADLLSRIDSLSEEVDFLSFTRLHFTEVLQIILEKRLGIAQLCLLLAVIVFMGLTRGSRVDTLTIQSPPRRFNVKEWGKRQLSLQGNRFTSISARDADVPAAGQQISLPAKHSPRHTQSASPTKTFTFPASKGTQLRRLQHLSQFY